MAYMYQQEVRHNGLNKYKIVKANSRYELEQKVNALQSQWNEQWQKKVEREMKIKDTENALKYANEQTEDAEKVQFEIDNLLVNSLNPIKLNFDIFKDKTKYSVKKPDLPILKKYPREPLITDEEFNPKPSLFIKISKKKMEEFKQNNEKQFEKAHKEWKWIVQNIEFENQENINFYNKQVAEWQSASDEFYGIQASKNKEIDDFREDFEKGVKEAVEKYFRLLLLSVKMPFSFEKNFEIEYCVENKNLIIDMLFPNKEEMPALKSVSYVKSKNEFKESFYSESQLKKKYDSLVYQLVLQTLNYVFNVEMKESVIDSVVLNGKISTIDKTTGKHIEPYILSINVKKEDFFELNLEAIDAKSWFKSAKGVSAATFVTITPVAPIVQMQKEDKRFIDGYSVVDDIDDSMNLAAMDWQDFENLIREIFEKEFNASGGEVKITRASRDGGVDAVAFDPDPIRGGKIVIQAKRYTNVVGVSAVRDLYGTVMNEGAIKGILVTTSNYGNDAYEFANGKPLTLMNGANLLYLLEKHGHKAKIDLKAAKQFFAENK